ncbi:hypothetical protein EYR41_005264 [Orbilia oligospora]|uniref:Uncharacterized protein n=1 Tax=Orbilia oligospora TaxID=2813651 RepID=A0A8H2E224_ORBOL|nr:hypothetical protein EYR41_005264 [Orbilia oligospora]
MYFKTIFPILCLTSSITCFTIPTGSSDDAKKPQDRVKAGSWPIISGPGPVLIDAEQFPPLNPLRKGRKNRRSLGPKSEPMPDTLGVHPEQVAQWMKELDEILSGESGVTKRSAIDGSPAQRRSEVKNPGLEKLKKRYDTEMANAWFNVGGGSHNDYRLIFDPSRSGFVEDWGSPGGDVSLDMPANQKRDGVELVTKVPRSPIVDKRSQALAEILAALYDQEDPNKFDAGNQKTLDRRAPIGAVSTPADAKPVQDEVIRRIFKISGNNKNKRDLSPRQSSQEVAQQILQTLFRFEDDEEWKWNAPSASARRRWSEFPEIEEISEGSQPEKRDHNSGRGISTDEINDRIKTDARDPNSYAWPDISLKVREALPKEADEVSQRIIVTIFRMQENFRHKRSLVEIEQVVKEVGLERRGSTESNNQSPDSTKTTSRIKNLFQPVHWYKHKSRSIIEIEQEIRVSVEPRGYRLDAGWLAPWFSRTCNIRLRWRWFKEHFKHNRRRDIDDQDPEAKLQRRTRYSIPPKPLPRPTPDSYDNNKWKQWCRQQRVCILPWNIRKLQSSRGILRRIIDSIDRHSQEESQMTKRDVASDMLAWLESINKYFEGTRNGIPSSDGQPTVTYASAAPEEKVVDGLKSAGGVARRHVSRDLKPVTLPQLSAEFLELIDKLRKEKYGDDIPDSIVYQAASDIINGVLKIFAPLKKRDVFNGISGIVDSIKLALRCKTPIQPPPTTILEAREPKPQGDTTRKLSKRYEPETYPWWSGSSENDGEDNVSTNPWSKGNPCARLKLTSGCGGSYKRSVGNARNRLDRLRKRITEEDEKKVSEKQTIDDDQLAERIKVRKGGKINHVLTIASANWKDPGFLRLNPFRDWKKFWRA